MLRHSSDQRGLSNVWNACDDLTRRESSKVVNQFPPSFNDWCSDARNHSVGMPSACNSALGFLLWRGSADSLNWLI